jgi:ABC-type transporter Mla subunit MlaD
MRSRQRLPVALALLATIAVVAAMTKGSSSSHQVAFVVSDAANLVPGLQVRAAGQKVGELASVSTNTSGHGARVVLKITDDKVWPLPRDSTFRARFGGTVAYTGRYIEIVRGTNPSSPFADGATIPASRVQMPVEFGTVVNIFGPKTREDLRATVNAAGAALAPAEQPLRRALQKAPDATLQAKGIAGDIDANVPALTALVRSTDRVVRAANSADPGIGPLIDDASATLQSVASRADSLKVALADLPATMSAARSTLARADGTLTSAADVTRRLKPGIKQLIGITPTLNHALATVTAIGPDARATLATARRSAPRIDRVLRGATRLMPDLQSALTQATTQLTCIRPYAPELAGFASTWASFSGEGDKKDKYARLYFGTYPFPNATPLSVPQAAKVFPTAFVSYAFPRAPGANVGQPWYQPGCGITADGADPQKNPEAGVFDPLSHPLIQINQPTK